MRNLDCRGGSSDLVLKAGQETRQAAGRAGGIVLHREA